MARKPVLEGGKKDEIISKALELFFEYGYEATSVRMILEQVGGEVGMFYHYFKSKEDLFQQVVELFFQNCQIQFTKMIGHYTTIEEFLPTFLDYYHTNVKQYDKLSSNMHWTIQSTMYSKMLNATLPAIRTFVEQYIQQYGNRRNLPSDILAKQLLYATSATLHSDSFQEMSKEEQLSILTELIQLLLGNGH